MSSHTAETELTFLGKLVLEGEIQCQTGLHIGAGKGSLEIGGADNPVVKDAFGIPYIPGSSLRGRLRSLLEQTLGLAVPNELVYLSKRKGQEVRIHQSDRPDDDICVLFGRNPGRVEKRSGEAIESPRATPARLTVYDAPLLVDSITPQMRENLDDELTEVKSENAVDRITSQANPRTLERVPAGRPLSFSHGSGCALRGRSSRCWREWPKACACLKTMLWAAAAAGQRPYSSQRPESRMAQQRLLRERRRRERVSFLAPICASAAAAWQPREDFAEKLA